MELNWQTAFDAFEQINSEGVTRNFYPGDKLQLWHEELEPQNSLLDILNAAGPEPMAMWSANNNQLSYSVGQTF